jgi:hypothetical protein
MGDGLNYWDDPREFKDGQPCNDPVCPAVKSGTPHTTDATHREVLRTLRVMRETPNPYGNQEFGYRGKDERRPFLSPAYKAMLDAQGRKPDRVHWVWFFLAAVLIIAPIEGYAVYLILK